ncbi:MAG TPA: GvpL/GvpF family gas vesicle protein [Chloroflexota bacterium]|nr:GvpL/GvpF family gas vesicle protein [Chloroflexota bacterium]
MTSDASTDGAGRGWYLYGVVRRPGPQGQGRRVVGLPLPEIESVEQGDLAAVVRPVALSEFDPDVVRRRAEDVAWLESVVQGHNDVIAAIHENSAILPAKFGSIYACRDDVAAALEGAQDTLRQRLDSLEGMDEWAVRVRAPRSAIDERASQAGAIRELEAEVAAATPGRAYFLQRQMERHLAARIDGAVAELGQLAYEDLARFAAESEANPSGAVGDEVEVLKAAFLVSRQDVEGFLAALHTLGDRIPGLTASYTGPWPPYSFATLPEGAP